MRKKKTLAVASADALAGKKIRARRLELGMSQTTLGKSIGVKFQQIQKHEKGVNLGAGRLQEMARVLDVPVSYFFAESADGGDMPNFDFLTMRYGTRISRAFPKIRSEGLQLEIVRLIEALAQD